MAKPTTCRMCGHAHWSTEPCKRSGAVCVRTGSEGWTAPKPKSPEAVRTHIGADYPGRDELLAAIEALKAENAKLKADAEATDRRRTRNRDRMAARRAGARP